MTLFLLLMCVALAACLLAALTLLHTLDRRARRSEKSLTFWTEQAAHHAIELAATRAEVTHLRQPAESAEPVGPLVVEFDEPVATDDMVDAAVAWLLNNPPPAPVNRNPHVPVSPGHADRTEQR